MGQTKPGFRSNTRVADTVVRDGISAPSLGSNSRGKTATFGPDTPTRLLRPETSTAVTSLSCAFSQVRAATQARLTHFTRHQHVTRGPAAHCVLGPGHADASVARLDLIQSFRPALRWSLQETPTLAPAAQLLSDARLTGPAWRASASSARRLWPSFGRILWPVSPY